MDAVISGLRARAEGVEVNCGATEAGGEDTLDNPLPVLCDVIEYDERPPVKDALSALLFVLVLKGSPCFSAG